MEQLIAHLIGDYVLQTHDMACRKTSSWFWALTHAVCYTLPFLVIFRPSLAAAAVICLTHALIDRYRLARFVIAWKNRLTSPHRTLVAATGFPAEVDPGLAFALLIVVDNTMHLCINYAALRWLG